MTVKNVIIIGGGVAGLTAAFTIRRLAEAGNPVDCTVVERSDRLGGKLASDFVDDVAGRYVIDGGCDSYLSAKPAVARMASLLGVADQIVRSREENKRTFIVKGDRLITMPDGIMMFAPTKFLPMLTTRLYSPGAKVRMGLDIVLPRKQRWADGETARDHDETLESFVTRRMGRECLERLAEPLVGGVHASDPARMSLAATFPNLLEMEQRFGSVIRGCLDQRKRVAAMRNTALVDGQPRTMFSTFRLGMQQLPEALARAVGDGRLLTGREVRAIERTSQGVWCASLDDGEVLRGDAVIIATEAWRAEALVRPTCARLADLLGSIPCSSSATVSMAFRSEDFPEDRRWFGVLCPAVEKRPILALTLSSSKWPGRAPEGRVLLRGFVGGPGNQRALDASDEVLVETVRSSVADLLGMRSAAEPVLSRVYRWEGGMPQYTLGHLGRVDEIERCVAGVDGLELAGSAYRGVGVPNCIDDGERAALSVVAAWGYRLEIDTGAGPTLKS